MSKVACFARRVALGLGVLAVAAVTASAQSISYVGGLQYASGDFVFTERTWSAYFSNGVVWSKGRFRTFASVPLVMQPAGWLQYSGAGMMVPSGGIGGSLSGNGSGMGGTGSGMHNGSMTSSSDMPFSRVGIGDPIARVDVALLRSGAERGSVRFVAAAKAPLADVDRGFGTGEWDTGAGLSGTLTVGGTSVLADAVYWKLGNPPGASLQNAVAFVLSVGRVFPRSRWSALGTVSGVSSLWKGLEPPVQAGMSIGYLLESGSSVFATAAAGLTRTAPTMSAGLGWRIALRKTQ